MTLDTIEITGMRECSSNPEVTNAVRLLVIEDWNALTAYVSQKLLYVHRSV